MLFSRNRWKPVALLAIGMAFVHFQCQHSFSKTGDSRGPYILISLEYSLWTEIIAHLEQQGALLKFPRLFWLVFLTQLWVFQFDEYSLWQSRQAQDLSNSTFYIISTLTFSLQPHQWICVFLVLLSPNGNEEVLSIVFNIITSFI